MTEHTPAPSNGDAHNRLPNARLYDRTLSELLESMTAPQRAAMGLLAQSVRHAIPLPPLLSGLAAELSSDQAFYPRLVQEDIAQGIDPIEATIQTPELIGPEASLALKLARDNGTLDAFFQAYFEHTPQETSIEQNKKSTGIRKLLSGLLKLAFGLWMVAWIFTYLFPQFYALFADFEVDPPPLPYVYFQRIANLFAFPMFLFFLLGLIALYLVIRNAPYLLQRLSPSRWRQTVLSEATRRKRALAVVAQSGFPEKIATLMTIEPLAYLFRHLDQASSSNPDTIDWQTLATNKIISQREAKALETTSSAEMQSWILRWSANQQAQRLFQRRQWIQNGVLVVANILMGLLVLVAATAIFSTLISLMQAMHPKP